MRAVCDVCESAPARVFCAADQAAMCAACDEKVRDQMRSLSRLKKEPVGVVSLFLEMTVCESHALPGVVTERTWKRRANQQATTATAASLFFFPLLSQPQPPTSKRQLFFNSPLLLSLSLSPSYLQIHSCNKLAMTHVRVELGESAPTPRCEECAESPGTCMTHSYSHKSFFLREKDPTFCIHNPNLLYLDDSIF